MRRAVGSAVYLCILIAFNSLDHTHSRKIDKHEAEKRTAGKKPGEKFARYSFSFLEFDNKRLDTIAKIATVTGNFYVMVSQCCKGEYNETCHLTLEGTNIAETMDQKSFEINEIVKQTKHLEEVTSAALDDFNSTVMGMHRIVQTLGMLLESLDSNVRVELNKTTQELMKQYAQKNTTSEKVEYNTIETSYFNVLDKVLGASTPNFTSILSGIPKLQLLIKALLGRYKVYELGQPVVSPDNSSERYQASKSWFGKQRSKIASSIGQIEKKLQTKYEKSFKKAESIKGEFDDLNSIAKSAYNTYRKYTKFTQCKDAYGRAKEGMRKLRKAKEKMEAVYKTASGSRDSMKEAGISLHKQLASRLFLNDLKELKGALEKLIGDGTDKGLIIICNNFGHYIDNINDQTLSDPLFVNSSKLISEIRSSMAGVPEYLKCYSAKARVVRTVLEGCKKGDGSLTFLNQHSRRLYEDEADSCQKKIGIAPFSDQKLQSLIDQLSKEQNFSKVCETNDKIKGSILCQEYCKGTDKLKLPKLFQVSVEAATIILSRCECELMGQQRKLICFYKNKGNTTQQILDLFPAGRFTLEQVERVECPKAPLARI